MLALSLLSVGHPVKLQLAQATPSSWSDRWPIPSYLPPHPMCLKAMQSPMYCLMDHACGPTVLNNMRPGASS